MTLFYILKEKSMQSSNTTMYIKKLVKIVYEKEKQIENMKRALKEKNREEDCQNVEVEIHEDIRRQIENNSTKMREVNQHVVAMQKKLLAVEEALESEINKNSKLRRQKMIAEENYDDAKRVIEEQRESLSQFQGIIRQLASKSQQYQQQINEGNQQEEERWEAMKEEEEKLKLQIIKLQTKVSENTLLMRNKASQLRIKDESLEQKINEIELLSSQLLFKEKQVDRLTNQLNKLSQNYSIFSNDFGMLKLEVETLQDSINMKQSQYSVLNQTLKDYEEFAFQISQYIQSAYTKHCCQGKLRSSKKLIREVDNCKTRFEAAFCKITQIQHWMDATAQKLEKIIEQHELPNDTLGDLSIIAHSFEQKLELCDLTERIEKEKLEMDKNEEILLDNLQKQVEKSELRDRTKLVELDEVKQILKVTKDINRQLLTELNSKEFIISECRKLYGYVIGGRSDKEYKNLKNLLNIKG